MIQRLSLQKIFNLSFEFFSGNWDKRLDWAVGVHVHEAMFHSLELGGKNGVNSDDDDGDDDDDDGDDTT